MNFAIYRKNRQDHG